MSLLTKKSTRNEFKFINEDIYVSVDKKKKKNNEKYDLIYQ